MKKEPIIGLKIGTYFRPQSACRTDLADFFLHGAVERQALHETSTKTLLQNASNTLNRLNIGSAEPIEQKFGRSKS